MATNNFQDLHAWQAAHQLVLAVYRATDKFPDDEKFGLTAQLRRAAISITSNISEGYGRIAQKDKEHFYVMANGSLFEVLNQLILARDLGYVTNQHFEKLDYECGQAGRLLGGLLRAHRSTKS